MEPVTLAFICTAIFGLAATLAAFIRQVLLSRDKELNDLAQQRALIIKAGELQVLYAQIMSNKRFNAHYQLLGSNKDAIAYFDEKIEDNFKKKLELIQQYADLIFKESVAIITGDRLAARKAVCDNLKQEINQKIALYDKEIKQLQIRRGNLWDCHAELQHYLLDQEALHNAHLNDIYQKYIGILEKIYQRHYDNSEVFAKYTIDTATQTLKSFIMMPVDLLASLFQPSTGIVDDVAKKERLSRKTIITIQDELNEDSHKKNHLLHSNRMYSSIS